MYPDTFLQWLGATAIVFGILVGVVAVALWIHERGGRR